MEGQLVIQLLRITLDDPQAKHFAHIQQRIGITVLFFQLGHFLGIADAAGNDPVHKGAAEGAVLIDILLKTFFQTPLVDILVDTLQKFLAVVVDQLAGQHDDTLLARLIPGIEYLRQLAGEGRTRLVIHITGRIIDDTGFGGVGNNDLQVVAGSDFHHGIKTIFFIGVQAAGNGGNDPLVIHLPAVLAAPQIQRIQAFLLIDHIG